MARLVLKGCECGALSTYGFGPGEVGHSYWCPWSTDKVAIPWFCENNGCMNGTAVAAIDPSDFSEAGIHYFCQSCWDLQQGLMWAPNIPLFTKHWPVIAGQGRN